MDEAELSKDVIRFTERQVLRLKQRRARGELSETELLKLEAELWEKVARKIAAAADEVLASLSKRSATPRNINRKHQEDAT